MSNPLKLLYLENDQAIPIRNNWRNGLTESKLLRPGQQPKIAGVTGEFSIRKSLMSVTAKKKIYSSGS